MGKRLSLIYLDQAGRASYSGRIVLHAVARYAAESILVVGAPDELTRLAIATLRKSGVAVEVKSQLSSADSAQLAMNHSITAFKLPH